MTIYFDYTAGRSKYEDYDENEGRKGKIKQEIVIKEFNPIKKAKVQENREVNSVQYKAKVQDRNDFYYSYEKESDNKKEVYTYGGQQRKQGPKKAFKPTQNYNKKPFNAYKPKNGKSYRRTEISIGSKYQRTDIQD